MKKADKERYQAITEMGCIVCLKFKGIFTPCDVHHLNGRTGNGNQETIGLCFYHHRQGGNCDEYVSRHPWLSEFEARYGNEQDLLKEVNELINNA